jgi:hypothetical protein
VPQGYAYGIWSFLEKRFRNTEQDTVMSLWQRLMTLDQEVDETHDIYKARVDSVMELLANAKQQVPPGLYASLLLWRLQPRYATAVLTLKTSDRLKDDFRHRLVVRHPVLGGVRTRPAWPWRWHCRRSGTE